MKKSIFFSFLMMFLLWGANVSAEITLAIVAPKAGPYLKAGAELSKGAQLAAEEFNNNGGLNGEKIDFLTIDDRCDDQLAVSTAEMLTVLKSKKIGLVLGPYCSNRFDEIASIYERAKIFQIVPTTEAYDAGDMRQKGQILLLGAKAQMSEDFFNFYNNNFAGLKVGFVYDGHPEKGYTDVAKTLYDAFRTHGKSTLLSFYTLNIDDDDIPQLARRVVKDDVNVVFVLGDQDDIADFIAAVKKKNENMIVFTGKKLISEDVLKDLDEAAEGMYVLDMRGLKDSLLFTESLVNLRLLGIEPEGLEAYGYVAVKLWGDLARQVNSFDYNKLIKAANSDDMKDKWGEFLMHSGSRSQAKYIIEQYKSSSFKQVY